MRSSAIFSLLAATTVAVAEVKVPKLASENIPNTVVIAEFAESKTSTVRGSLTFTIPQDSVGVNGALNLTGLPANGGPFSWHIHEKPVPADGNCTATGKHFDPTGAGAVDSYKCNPGSPQTCEIGDLSGKVPPAQANGGALTVNFVDRYIVTNQKDKDYIGNLSFVVHSADKSRIACTNFVLKSAAGNATTVGSKNNTVVGGSGTLTPPTPTPSSSGSPNKENAAHKMGAGAGALLITVAGMAFLL